MFTAATRSAPMEPREEITVVTGVGVEGDRYAAGRGRFSGRVGSGQALTLIEEEAIQAVRSEYGIDLELSTPRRNVVTSRVPLNHLVGIQFRLGEAVVLGVSLAEPCNHLGRLAGIPGLRRALVHRGGLRADVLRGGKIRLGDLITPA